jgi:hypothetical protein
MGGGPALRLSMRNVPSGVVGPSPAYDSPGVVKDLAEMKAFKSTRQQNAIFRTADPADRPTRCYVIIHNRRVLSHHEGGLSWLMEIFASV